MPGWKRSHNVDTYEQEEQMNCALASCAMAIHFVKGDRISTAILATESRRIGGRATGYVRANVDNPTMKRVLPVLPSRGVRVMHRRVHGATEIQDDAGTAMSANLPGVLDTYGIDAHAVLGDLLIGERHQFAKATLKGLLNAATQALPVLISLIEPSHVVICIGHTQRIIGANRYAIIDPGNGELYEAAHVSENKLIFRNYNTPVKAVVVVTGTHGLSAGKRKVM